jgi:hypothetical protein
MTPSSFHPAAGVVAHHHGTGNTFDPTKRQHLTASGTALGHTQHPQTISQQPASYNTVEEFKKSASTFQKASAVVSLHQSPPSHELSKTSFCNANPTGLYSDAHSCSRYVECLPDGLMRHLACPAGTYFNPDWSACMLPDDDKFGSTKSDCIRHLSAARSGRKSADVIRGSGEDTGTATDYWSPGIQTLEDNSPELQYYYSDPILSDPVYYDPLTDYDNVSDESLPGFNQRNEPSDYTQSDDTAPPAAIYHIG